ncbi:MAG: hypothetical protein ABIG61_04045 [Planctomycetota bacterium]
MKSLDRKSRACILLILPLAFIVGCQEQASTNNKKAKLLADKNYRMQQQHEEQLKQRDSQIREQQNLLQQCRQQQEELKKQMDESVTFLMENLPQDSAEQSMELETENSLLKERIEQLQQEIEKLKAEQPGSS